MSELTTTHAAPPHRINLRWAGGVFVVASAVGLGWWWIYFSRPVRVEADLTIIPKSVPIEPKLRVLSVTEIAALEPATMEQIASSNPRNAILRTRELAASNPSQARELGYNLIAALHKVGAHALAAEFAVTETSAFHRDFTIAAYHEWGRSEPDQAWGSAIRIGDPTTRQSATQSVLSGWARSDPEGMAEAALAFPEGEEKKVALTKALRAWMIKDPDTAGDWIMAHEAAIPVADEFFTKDRR